MARLDVRYIFVNFDAWIYQYHTVRNLRAVIGEEGINDRG